LFDSKAGIHVPTHQRQIGVVFQDSRLFPHLNVRDNLNYGFNLLAAQDRRLGFNQIVELLEVGHLLKQKPHQLSGGEKQRVAFGRALLTSPRLLLLDEPLASLDTRLKNQILPFLLRVKEETKIPMLYVSHAIDEILYLTSQIAIIENGKLLANGKFHEIIHQENLQNMAHSLGLENVICANVVKHDDIYSLTELKHGIQTIVMPLITAKSGLPVTISIAASNVALSLNRIKNVTIQNQLQGIVTDITQLGYRILVTVNIGGSLMVAEVTTKAVQTLSLVLGSKVYCLVKAQSIRGRGLIVS
jgi:molybdate transport system ATP-binding protein